MKLRKKYLLPTLAFSLPVLILTWLNYVPGSWLTGWDNLHPEFNFLLNIRRSFSVLWQEYQGLGLLGGMAHAADLPRQLIFLALSLFVPAHLVRYLWTFLMLFIGPFGVYVLISQVVLTRASEPIDEKRKLLAGLGGGLFYLLNLATVQYFYTPFETFVSFYGFLPWLLTVALQYLREGGRSNLLRVLVVSVMAAPAFFVHTMFIVYLVLLAFFGLEAWAKFKKMGLARNLKLAVVILAANAYWLLPVSYFTLANSEVVRDAKISVISTPETQLMNQGFGGFKDTLLLKGFWFDYLDLVSGEDYGYLMAPWRDHVAQPQVQTIGYGLFAIALIGLVWGIRWRGNFWKFSILGILALVYFMLASSNPPFGFLFTFLSENAPLFGQVFRSVFTKWSVVAALVFAWGLGLFLFSLTEFLRGKLKLVSWLLAGAITLGMLFQVRPAFEGNLIWRMLRLNRPVVYEQLFNFFEEQYKDERIAFFPVQTYWGWNFHDWGYRGSGFLWYGIEQPILDRAFDVWSRENETYYHQISTAVYQESPEDLRQVLDEYDVSFVLIDKSVTVPKQESGFLRIKETEAMLEEIDAKVVWEKDFLKVYDLREVLKQEGFIATPENFVLGNGDTQYGREDYIFKTYGNYVSDGNSRGASVVFPFLGLLKEEVRGVSFQEEDSLTRLVISQPLDGVGEGYELVIPGFSEGLEYRVPAVINYQGTKLAVSFKQPFELKLGDREVNMPELPDLRMETEKAHPRIHLTLGKEVISIGQDEEVIKVVKLAVGESLKVEVFDDELKDTLNLKNDFLTSSVSQCWTREGVDGLLQMEKTGDVLIIKTRDAAGCLPLNLGQLGETKVLVDVSLPYRSNQGAHPHFCLAPEDAPFDCQHDEIFYHSSMSKDWTEARRQTVLAGGVIYWLNVSARPPNEEGKEWQIEYQAPMVTSYPLVASFEFEAEDMWPDLKTETRISSQDPADLLTVSFLTEGEKVDFIGRGRFEIDNCDLFDRGWVEKEILGESVNYKAGSLAAACDFVLLDEVSTKQSHLLRFVGGGAFGRGQKVYLFNLANKRNDLEVLLAAGQLDQSFALLPWPELEEEGYILNIETRSLGSEVVENRLDKVVVYHLPLDWLARWKLEPTANSFGGRAGIETFENEVDVSRITKTGTFLYNLSIDSKTDPGLIVLSQGFDGGWVAYKADDFQLPLPGLRLLSPTFADDKLEHLKINSWANGWFVPEGQHRVIILYWPQYLEYLGFALLFVILIWLLARRDQSYETKEQIVDRQPI
jgi:hypothetical protein